MLLVCEPPMYGRLAAGHSTTSATNQPDETMTARAAAPTWRTRRTRVVGAAHR